MQEALRSFYRGNSTSNNWTTASNDVGGGLASGGLSALLQVIVFSRNGTGNPGGLFNVTDDTVEIQLPGTAPNGSAVFLGDPDLGYPAMCAYFLAIIFLGAGQRVMNYAQFCTEWVAFQAQNGLGPLATPLDSVLLSLSIIY